MSRWLKVGSIGLMALLLATALLACAQPHRLVGGQWVSDSGRTLAFRADGTADVQGMTASYSMQDSTIMINGRPGYEEVRWISDDQFAAREVLAGLPGREQLFNRRR